MNRKSWIVRLQHRFVAVVAPLVRRLGARAYLLVAAIFSLLLLATPALTVLADGAQSRLFDLLISHRIMAPKPDPDIVIIDIDEASLAGMAAKFGRWPWPNQVLGELVTGIEAQKPRAIVFDILFSDRDPMRPESDAAFDAAIAASKTTLFPMLRLDPRNDALSQIPVSALPGVRKLDPDADPKTTIAMILPKVPAALDNGRLGSNQVVPDKDGVIRRNPSWIEHRGWALPSLPQRVAEHLGLPGADRQDVLLNWRGPPFSYRFASFVDVYQDLTASAKRRPANEFEGKIVIIGSTAPSLFDIKASPMAHVHPGVEILATAIDNFRHADYLREQPHWLTLGAAIVLIWSMAIALYREIRIDIFDTVFGVLQGSLLAVSYVMLNLGNWYLDASAPLSLGLAFFAVARVYHGLSRRWLADSQVQSIADLPSGSRQLAVLAIRLKDMDDAERRHLKSEIDRLVSRMPLSPGRILSMIEDPGFINKVFADTTLVYWLLSDVDANWRQEARLIEDGLRASGSKRAWASRLGYSQHAEVISWQQISGWRMPALQAILVALSGLTHKK